MWPVYSQFWPGIKQAAQPIFAAIRVALRWASATSR
jgi:hypothetical protein